MAALSTRRRDSRVPSAPWCHGNPPIRTPLLAVGTKVERWLKTPFDILTFGPRVGAGALLSVPERLQTL